MQDDDKHLGQKNTLLNLQKVKREIRDSAQQTKHKNVTLIIVTKKFSMPQINPLLDHHSHFGENQVQEASEKWSSVKKIVPNIKLHALGTLQTNKARDAVKLFDCIHTLDRERIAKALAEEMAKARKKIPCFIQVNIGDEKQKSGIHLEQLENFLKKCINTYQLQVCGLMCIPPQQKLAAPYFALLAKLAQKHRLPKLSMGMSADFKAAVALGATHVRVGSAIMGERG